MCVLGEKDVAAVLVRCSNSCVQDDTTCSWTGELGDLKYHHSTCPQQLLLCPNKCATEDGKAVEVTCKYLQKHLEDDCSMRPYTCPHCNEEGTYLERTESHIDTCPNFPIICPNTPCSAVATRSVMKRHETTECLYATVKCRHSDVGCSTELRRKELTEHEADVSSHLETAKAMIVTLKGHVKELTENMGKLEVKMKKEMELKMERELASALDRAHLMRKGQTTFKMGDFGAHKHKEFKSKPFYTGRQGYKLCVIIEANGVPKVRGAYVSVYAHLMRGEYDNKLLWPLVGTVTFELLNQLGDHNHRKRTCTFPPDDKDNHRLVHQEIAGAGYGCPKFISHAKLSGADLPKDVQYLKDDAIYLRVSMDAPDPVGQDWLRCY